MLAGMCFLLKKRYVGQGLHIYRKSSAIRRKATNDLQVLEIERDIEHMETRLIESISYERVGFLSFLFYLNASSPARFPADPEGQPPSPFAGRATRAVKDVRTFDYRKVRRSRIVPGEFFLVV